MRGGANLLIVLVEAKMAKGMSCDLSESQRLCGGAAHETEFGYVPKRRPRAFSAHRLPMALRGHFCGWSAIEEHKVIR